MTNALILYTFVKQEDPQNKDSLNTRKDETLPYRKQFNLSGHLEENMIPNAIEQVFPKDDPLLRKGSRYSRS